MKKKEVPVPIDSSDSEEVEAPYRAVKEINHREIPVKSRKPDENVAPGRSHEKAYKLVAPIDQSGNDEKLLEAVLKAKAEVELGRLIQAAPELAKKLRRAITKTRQPIPKNMVDVLHQHCEWPYLEDEIVPEKLDQFALDIAELPRVSAFYISTDEDHQFDSKVEIGNIMIPDPYLQYLADLPLEEIPKQVYVAGESASLRVIFPRVNASRMVESVIDSGSQIVSMSLTEAEDLLLTWDPDIQIYMQSANGQLKKSVGLARNVPFLFGDITVYLQVHIIDGPAYKILLGRPFDILTESQVENKANGTQTVTLKDPNTKKRCTLPTHARGTYSIPKKPLQKFPSPEKGIPITSSSKKAPPKESRNVTMEEVTDDEDDDSEDDPVDSEDDEERVFRKSSMN